MKLKNIVLLLWVAKSFFDIDSMVKFLNELPNVQALNAKIFVINSQRSFLGAMSDPYYVVYPSDLK